MECRQNIFIINLIDCLTFRHPINVDNPPAIEKNNHNCFEFGLAHARFLLPRGLGALLMHGLSLSLWIILKNSSFVTRNYVLEEIRIILNVFKGFITAIHSMFLLLGGKFFFGTTLAHTFFMPRSSCKICLTLSLLMLVSSEIARMLSRLSPRTILATFSTFS